MYKYIKVIFLGYKTCQSKMSLWHVDYFKLKTVKVQKAQEEILTFPQVPKIIS